jgi:hypothetical protein
VEYAKLLPAEERKAALEKAAAANPKWAEPYKLLARIEVHPAQKLAALRKGFCARLARPAGLDRDGPCPGISQTDGRCSEVWAAAERTTDDPTQRDQIRQLRAAGERARAEADMNARDEARRKSEQEMQDLKNRALMEIRKAESRANAGKPIIDDGTLDVYKEQVGEKCKGSWRESTAKAIRPPCTYKPDVRS